MPPKTAKKGSTKKSVADGGATNKDWEAGLTSAQFEEESWQACVSLVVGETLEDEQLIQALALAVQQPQRKLFSVVTLDSTLAKIHELGNPKAKKTDDVPMFYEVTEPAKLLLDAGEEIPYDLMAKLLKFQLLHLKANDQQRREAELAEDMKAKAGPPHDRKDKGGTKTSNKKGKAPPSPSGPSREKKTKLKRRDDVEPPKYIDDEPDDGPQHYVLVLGFHQPQLILALDAIDVHVANVIKLCSQHRETSEGLQGQNTIDGDEQSLRASPLVAEAIGSEEQATQGRKLDLFWSGLRPVLDSGPVESKLHDVVQLSCTVQDIFSPIHTQEAALKMRSHIFERVASLIYDCLQWRRQHQHYRDNIRLISIPTVGFDSLLAKVVPNPQTMAPLSKKESLQRESNADKETAQLLLSEDVDMRYYDYLLDLVPPESCSVSLVLHCMLEQVVISTDQSQLSHVPDDPINHNTDQLDHQLLQTFLPLVYTEEEKAHMLNGLLTSAKNEEDKKRLLEIFKEKETQKKPQDPLVIRHHDERALRFRDFSAVQGFDPVEIERSMIRLFPVWKVIRSVTQQSQSKSCWMAIKQQLQHYCTDDVVSWPEVERLFHHSVFESMQLTRLDQNGVLMSPGPLGTLEPAQQQASTIIPWDNPLSYAKEQLRNLHPEGLTFITQDPDDTEEISRTVCTQLDLSHMQRCRQRSLFDWYYAEHHSASIFQQVLRQASEHYRCLDTYRGSQNNILYIFCHNPMSPDRQCKEYWDVALHTDVKFRKYLEHVADSISDWTKEEELKREAMLIRNPSPDEAPKDEKDTDSAEEEEEEEDTLEPFIRKDSLKAWKLEQERLKEEEAAKKLKMDNTTKGKQQKKEDAVSKDGRKSKTLTSGKKSRAETADGSAKTPTESITTTVPPVDERKKLQQTEEIFTGFTGYSMDGKLIRVSGRLQHLFPSDGGHIIVEDISYVGGSTLMKVTVKKDGHHFCTHINHVVDEPKHHHLSQEKESNGQKESKVSVPAKTTGVKQGSLSAVLHNGIHLSYSFYGPTGEYTDSHKERVEGVMDTSTAVSNFLPSSTHCSKGADLDSKKHHPSGHTRPLESQVSEGQPELSSSPFNSLTLSVPNGLLLQFLREDTQGVSSGEQGVLVKQSFPLHRRGAVGKPEDPSLSKELSRIITCQGAVIRHMRDKSTEVLFADGSVSVSRDSGPVWVPDSEVEKENTKKDKKQSLCEEADGQRGCWLTTTPSGTCTCTVGTTHRHIPTKPLLTFKATDPNTHEVMLSREDLVVSVQNVDRSLSVEHTDGTRITTLYQERPPNTPQDMLQTGEQPESATVKSTSDCVCGCSECVCGTRCADSINENVHAPDPSDRIEDRSRNSTGKICDACTGLNECEPVCNEREGSVLKNGEDSVCAEETSAENDERFVCKSDKGSVSTKERVVLVEKEGCATIVMYPERQTAHIFLADGSVITGDNQGDYQVFPSSIGLLHIQSDGKCVYSPNPLLTPSPNGGHLTNQLESYTMSHADNVVCDITDPEGSHFQVMADGHISVLNYSPSPSTFKQDEEESEDKEDRENTWISEKNSEHCPRLFLVHDDGSATELVNAETVEEDLYHAYLDPSIALLKEPLPDTQDEFGITILKPSHKSVWAQWLLGKQKPDITPAHFRNRTWHDFPTAEGQRKSQGSPFGTDIGRGLTLMERSGGSATQCQPVRSCPKVLEMRELYQHRPFTTSFKNTVDTRLKGYIEILMEREQRSEEMRVKDSGTEEESVHVSDLLNLVLSFAEEDDAGHTFDRRSSAVDIANLYSQGVEIPTEDVSEDATTAASDSFTLGKESKWSERLAQDRQEMFDQQAFTEALRKKNVVPYFHPENLPLYQNLIQHQTPDMRHLSLELPPFPKSGGVEAFLKDAPQESAPRPLNPTPSQSASHAARSDRLRGKRSTNPTPQTAGKSSNRASPGHCKSVNVSVTGEPRRTKVRLPASILSSKPCSVPNQQFQSVEEPVRRKCRTISLTDPNSIVRGFQLLPSSVDFGTLQEGTTSAITVVMKNVGVDTCRFHVKQPPPHAGLRVIYNAGPVAAGLHAELKVLLFATCAAQVSEAEPKKPFSHDIIIHTETDIHFLPVTATILSERLYDVWLKEHSISPHKRSKVHHQSFGIHTGQRVAQPHRPPSSLLMGPSADTGHN